MLFDIDWQGARQLKERMGADVVSVFILPPDGKALERRLQTRAPGQRGGGARGAWPRPPPRSSTGREYDYVIVNADLDASSAGLAAILAAERLKRDAASRPRRLRAGRAGGAVRRSGVRPIASMRLLTSSSARGADPFRQPLEHVGEAGEVAHGERLGAQRRGDAGGGEQRLRVRRSASAGSGAASCGAGRRRRRSPAPSVSTRHSGEGCSMGVNSTMAEDTDGARREGLGLHREQQAGARAPLGDHGQAPVGLGAGRGDDALGHLLLEHQHHARVPGRPGLALEPADQQHGGDVVGQVGGDDRLGSDGRRRAAASRRRARRRSAPPAGPDSARRWPPAPGGSARRAPRRRRARRPPGTARA